MQAVTTTRGNFWRDAIAWRRAITPVILPRIGTFGLYALVVSIIHLYFPWRGIEAGTVQYTGGVLALLLVLRTNAGYERWWEGRQLWGGIVNQSRNLAIAGLAYGPTDPVWKDRYVRWTAAFPHVARASLRGERHVPGLEDLVGPADARRILSARHMPSHVLRVIASFLHEAHRSGRMEDFAFLAADHERSDLLDHVGHCERIIAAPLPRVHRIKLRRFIVAYLLALPFAVVSEGIWLSPLVTMLVAYPLLAVDQIGQELENPFSAAHLDHLPLNDICGTIETNLRGYLDEQVEPWARHIAGDDHRTAL